jgi:hypothetical protein
MSGKILCPMERTYAIIGNELIPAIVENDYCYLCKNECKKIYRLAFPKHECKEFEDNYKPVELIHNLTLI